MSEGLVMVDKARLRELRTAHTNTVALCRRDDSLASAWMLLGAQAVLLDTLMAMMLGEDDGGEFQSLAVPIRRREERISAADMEANLRKLGWTEEQLTPDLRAALGEIAANLEAERDARHDDQGNQITPAEEP